jgi:hypothetical protein
MYVVASFQAGREREKFNKERCWEEKEAQKEWRKEEPVCVSCTNSILARL